MLTCLCLRTGVKGRIPDIIEFIYPMGFVGTFLLAFRLFRARIKGRVDYVVEIFELHH